MYSSIGELKEDHLKLVKENKELDGTKAGENRACKPS